MRVLVTPFLVLLLIMVVGFSFGLFTLNLGVPEDQQLVATGALAYGGCYYDDYGDFVCPEVWDLPEGTVLFAEPDGSIPEGPFYIGQSPVPIIDEDGYLLAAPGEALHPFDEPYYVSDLWNYSSVADDPWYYETDLWGNRTYGWDENVEWETVVVKDPWYVEAFPGFGKIAQQMIPGQQQSSVIVKPVVVSAPSPTPSRQIHPQPSCWVSANPTSVPYGGSSTIEWQSFNASRVSFNDTGAVPTQGSRVVSNITNDRMYTVSVLGQGGSSSCYTRISIHGSGAAPSCVISAHPQSVRSGQQASLAWVSENAQSAALSGVGQVSTSGGRFVAPRQTTTYTLTVSGGGGTSSCSTQIGVLP